MEMKRVFRQDYTSPNKDFKFNGGDRAVVLKIKKPDIKISVNAKTYTVPFRDFIIVTKLNAEA